MAEQFAARSEISQEQLKEALSAVWKALSIIRGEKGDGRFASIHEILGVVAEEYSELIGAVRSHAHFRVREELIDIAAAAIFGVACVDAKALDW